MATLEITLLFLGSIIGAGFATGAEIVTFFGNTNLPTWCIAIIIGLSIFLIITSEIFLFYRTSPSVERSKFQCSSNATKFLYIVFVMIYLILYTAMTAGVRQITNNAFCIISLVISIYITLHGVQKLSRINIYFVLIIATLIVTTTLPHLQDTTTALTTPIHTNSIIKLLKQGIIYAGLNCFIFPELIIKTANKYSKKSFIKAGFLTACTVSILVFLILTTIQATHTQTAPIPLLAAANHHTTLIIILLAILTSQYTTLFAIIQRLNNTFPITNKKPLLTAVITCVIAYIISLTGFNQIIQFGYPLIGIFTCFYLLISFLMKFWQFLQFRQH